MWRPDEIDIELEVVDGPVALVRIRAPAGILHLIGIISLVGRVLVIDKAHIEGPGRGSIGRVGLNAIAVKMMVEADVDEIVVQGSTRTTGRNRGRPPWLFRYPHRLPASGGRGDSPAGHGGA